MKKKYLAILLATTLLFAGCGNNNSATVTLKVKNVSMSMVDTESPVWEDSIEQYEFGSEQQYVDEEVQTNRKGQFNGTSSEMEYDHTEEGMFTAYAVDIYKDEDNNKIEYGFKRDTGELVSYVNREGLQVIDAGKAVDKDTVIKTVTGLAGEYINTDEYTLEILTHVMIRDEEGVSSRTEEGFYVPEENETAHMYSLSII
ncbi:MAG: hypothetical protein ACI39R_04525 [Lachnospiraceae bacterium]